MISFKKINFSYEQNNVLNDFSLEIEKGRTTILLGKSGCGKSTIIRLITGLIKSNSGSLRIDEKDITEIEMNEFRKNIGYVIQDGGLFPHLTAEQNIVLMAKQLGWSAEIILNRIIELSALTSFDKKLLAQFPNQLSGGQKQRVGLMRALFLNPNLLLLDEPFAALDPLIRFELQKEFKKLFIELKITVLMVTHDLGEAVFMGDKIVLVNEGSVEQEGIPNEIMNNPKTEFVERFVNAQKIVL